MASRYFAVVPAAGRSVRMGQAKLLLPWATGTLVEHVLGAWRGSRVTATVIVVHPDVRELTAVSRRAGVEVLVANEPPPDMKASVALGLRYWSETRHLTAADSWLVAPADLPLLESRTIDAVLAAHEPTDSRIVVPTDPVGKRSHPVLFPWPLADEVPRLPAHEGLKSLLAQHPVHEISVPWLVPSADVDTPEDYRRLRDRYDRNDRPRP
ncbi:MAG: nucleotidyltransferase family protein [Planctomycetaceae bacterium]|nr:nucleotidyltransferase family protein [Planctomycetaceae bacterium]